ncbi:hypothetical protein AG1IA_05451 [Rhizoctonia solani AG-1 IA]|uniref:Uncharacterized protein n=1 Tax=Thanatephorus cucumeris (strain AG1-IA) TaxID=983506 RepID=L8WVY5_THACA|nr:hypothetical protein AG1IA_05451 [Rhizoctonia solani AG-1 IA]
MSSHRPLVGSFDVDSNSFIDEVQAEEHEQHSGDDSIVSRVVKGNFDTISLSFVVAYPDDNRNRPGMASKLAGPFDRVLRVILLLTSGHATSSSQRRLEKQADWVRFRKVLMIKLQNIGVVVRVIRSAAYYSSPSTYSQIGRKLIMYGSYSTNDLRCLPIVCLHESPLNYIWLAVPLVNCWSPPITVETVGAWVWLETGQGTAARVLVILLGAALMGNAGACFVLGAASQQPKSNLRAHKIRVGVAFGVLKIQPSTHITCIGARVAVRITHSVSHAITREWVCRSWVPTDRDRTHAQANLQAQLQSAIDLGVPPLIMIDQSPAELRSVDRSLLAFCYLVTHLLLFQSALSQNYTFVMSTNPETTVVTEAAPQDQSYQTRVQDHLNNAIRSINNVVSLLSQPTPTPTSKPGAPMRDHYPPSVIEKFKEYSRDCSKDLKEASELSAKWHSEIATQYQKTISEHATTKKKLEDTEKLLSAEALDLDHARKAVDAANEVVVTCETQLNTDKQKHDQAKTAYDQLEEKLKNPPLLDMIIDGMNAVESGGMSSTLDLIRRSNEILELKTKVEAAQTIYDKSKKKQEEEKKKLEEKQSDVTGHEEHILGLKKHKDRLESELETLKSHKQSLAELNSRKLEGSTGVLFAGAGNIDSFLSMRTVIQSIDNFTKLINSKGGINTHLVEMDSSAAESFVAGIRKIVDLSGDTAATHISSQWSFVTEPVEDAKFILGGSGRNTERENIPRRQREKTKPTEEGKGIGAYTSHVVPCICYDIFYAHTIRFGRPPSSLGGSAPVAPRFGVPPLQHSPPSICRSWPKTTGAPKTLGQLALSCSALPCIHGRFATKPAETQNRDLAGACRKSRDYCFTPCRLASDLPASGLAHTECRGTAGLGRPPTSQTRGRAPLVHPRCFAAAGVPKSYRSGSHS